VRFERQGRNPVARFIVGRKDVGMAARVRRVQPGEGPRLRDVRLRALEDTPTAFASNLASEATRLPTAWDEDALVRSEGWETATFIAEEDGRWLGLVGAYRPADRPGVVELVSMWVDPAARGQGLGACLATEVLEWARAGGAAKVELWVTTGNEQAMSLYRRLGFATTSNYQALPSDPCRDEVRMFVALAPNGA
jgi:ribosomal protein S18 acetylase RimI-like enzyme